MKRIVLPFIVLSCVLLCASCPSQFVPLAPAGGGCVKTIASDIDIPLSTAADILIVVDNSGSMLEEQQNLVENFLNQDPAECPLQDLRNIPADLRDPARDKYTGDGVLSQCGFVQLVAAYDNDFRIGVITTDVGICDNRIPAAQGGEAWGFRPQRGCLQPDGPPGAGVRKVIARADLDDDDDANDDFAQRFADTLSNIQTFGSPFERPLDAMHVFLDPTTQRGPGCENDLATFRRSDASLVVVFLTDEEDCSHGLDGKLEIFGDENAGEVCGEFADHFTNPAPAQCYSAPDALSPVESYVASLVAHDPAAKVAVVAGGVGVPGSITPEGCIVGGDGAPAGGDDVCFESGGLSNFNGPGNQPCGPDTADDRDGLPCCVADPGTRLYAFADLAPNRATDSICNQSFRATMLDIAAFIAASDVVELAEPPDSPDAIVVEVSSVENGNEVLTLSRLADDADCALETGYKLEGDTRVILCGEARPGPGDSVRVRARGEPSIECNEPHLVASGGGVNCQSTSVPGLLAFMVLAFALPISRRMPRRPQAAALHRRGMRA